VPGTQLGRIALPQNLVPTGLDSLIHDLFPNGVTNHVQWLWRSIEVYSLHEAIFEYVRRGEFADKPSRFESIFAFGQLDDARTFLARYPVKGVFGGNLLRVEGESRHRGNLALFDVIINPGHAILAARAYWSGTTGLAPALWEQLLCPPVQVLDIIE
jgi:hypothetical protein